MLAHDISFKFELYQIISLIYIGPVLKSLKGYISIIMFLLRILFCPVTLVQKKVDRVISSHYVLFYPLIDFYFISMYFKFRVDPCLQSFLIFVFRFLSFC